MHDPANLRPHTDDYTADILHQALTTLAWLRGLDHDTDPAVRLHLLTSIRNELAADITHTTLAAHHHGYNPTQIATILHLPG